MKKIIALVLVGVMCCTFMGCGLFTNKSEVTKCEVQSHLEPVCEITLK